MFTVSRALTAGVVLLSAFLTAGSPAQPVATVLNPPNAGQSYINHVNSAGWMVGGAKYPDEYDWFGRPMLWRPDGSIVNLDPGGLLGSSEAFFITDSGVVLIGVPGNYNEAYLWDSANGMRRVQDLGPIDGYTMDTWLVDMAQDASVLGICAYGNGTSWFTKPWINRNGTVTEIVVPGAEFEPRGFTSSGVVYGYARGDGYNCPVFWYEGTSTPMPSLTWYEFVDMNGSGAGICQRNYSDNPVLIQADGTLVTLQLVGPDYWDPASGTWKPTAFGEIDNPNLRTKGIDELGRVYGTAWYTRYDPQSGYMISHYLWVWDNGTTVTCLLPGAGDPQITSINDKGQAVGHYWLNSVPIGFLWEPFNPSTGLMVLPGMDSTHADPRWINGSGLIVGTFVTDDQAPIYAAAWGLQKPSVLDVSTPVVSTRNPKILTVTLTIGNPGADVVRDVVLTSATLNGAGTNTVLPLYFGTLKPGAVKKVTLQFKRAGPGEQSLAIKGTCSKGDFYSTQTVTVN